MILYIITEMPGEILYDNAVNNAKLAQRTSELAGILWHQGENDSHFEEDANTYQQRFIQMITQIKKACFNDALKLYGKEMSVDELMPYLLEDEEFYQNSGGGVTLSGGECLMQADFCAELLKELKKRGIKTAVDTCRFVSRDAIDKVMPYTDIFLYDIKAIDEDVHIKCTGQSNKIILKNLKYIDDCGKKTEIRIPYVPGLNDNQIKKISEFVNTLKNVKKVRVLPYHNYASSKYKALGMADNLPQKLPTNEEISSAQKMFNNI